MIHGFEPSHAPERPANARFRWSSALGAGLIAGIVLLVVPRGSPWSTFTFFTPVVMGRQVPADWVMGRAGAAVCHLAVSLVYGWIISRVVAGVTQLRSFIGGGLVGLALYLVNFGVVWLWIPALRGNEVSVAFTHLVFGLIAGGAYRGLLPRDTAPAQGGA